MNPETLAMLASLTPEKVKGLLALLEQTQSPKELERIEKEKEYVKDLKCFEEYNSRTGYVDECGRFEDCTRKTAEKCHKVFLKYPKKKFYVIVRVINFRVVPVKYYVEEQFHYDIDKLTFIDERTGKHRQQLYNEGKAIDTTSYAFQAEPYIRPGNSFNARATVDFGTGAEKYINVYKNVEIFGLESVNMLEIMTMMIDSIKPVTTTVATPNELESESDGDELFPNNCCKKL